VWTCHRCGARNATVVWLGRIVWQPMVVEQCVGVNPGIWQGRQVWWKSAVCGMEQKLGGSCTQQCGPCGVVQWSVTAMQSIQRVACVSVCV